MQYSTLQSLISEMSLTIVQQLAPWVEGSDEVSGDFFDAGVSDTVLNAVEATAIGELHGYLRGIYALPLVAPFDPLVVQTVNELMHYQLYKQRDAANLPDKIAELYKSTLNRLKQIQNRQVVLDAPIDVVDATQPQTFQSITPVAKFPSGFTRIGNGNTFRSAGDW